MKRARIILTALAVLAVVGTTLAYNAKLFTTYYVYKIDEDGNCPKLGRFDAGTISQSQVYTTTVDAGASVLPTICNQTFSVGNETP